MATSLHGALVEKDAAKRFVQKISVSTSGTITALVANTTDDTPLPVSGGMLCLQADVAFHYALRTAGATTAVTVFSGSKPGTRVLANQQEYVQLAGRDVGIDIIADSAGNLAIHLCSPA